MDADQFRKAAQAVIEDVISYFDTLQSRPPLPSIKPGYLAPQLPREAPQNPEKWNSIMQDISSKIEPGLTHWQSPNFMAFFPATTSYPSILGEIYSAAFSAPAFNWLCSPACTELETVVLDWLAEALGLSDAFLSSGEGGGVLQGSASEAVVVAMVAARERWVREQLEKEGLLSESADEKAERTLAREDRAVELRSKMVALGSEMSHSSTQKAANILGMRYRIVAANKQSQYRMTGAALRAKVEELKSQGLIPFYVTSTLGTTSTCSVDDFEGLVAVRRDHPELWIHVDAAFAGSALLCEEFRVQSGLRWINEMDSFNFNMHKWLLTNFDASPLYVRQRSALINALSITPSYLINPSSISGLVTDYRDWQIPLGRRFRSLKIWFVLRTYGISGLQDLVRRSVALGETFAKLVRTRSDIFEVISGPSFALTVIRCVASKSSAGTLQTNGHTNEDREMNGFGQNANEHTKQIDADEAANALTKQVYDLVHDRGEIFLSNAVIDGQQCIRVVSANERANEECVRKAFDILVNATEEINAARL